MIKPDKNVAGKKYWDASWPESGIQSFSLHSTFIEKNKWSYLVEDLAGHQGTSVEVGCGAGHFSALLAQAGFRALCVDYSPQALVCARRSFSGYSGRERKRYVRGNAFQLPFPDHSVDLVVSTGLLEHFEDINPPIREMARVLKSGGTFYADIVPDKFSLIGLFDFLYSSPPGFFEAKLNREDIQQAVTGAGLQIIRLFGAGVLPPRNVPAKGRIPFFNWLEKRLIQGGGGFWRYFDQTRLGSLLGLYYYVTARKP